MADVVPVLEVTDLSAEFPAGDRRITVVDGVSFSVGAGASVGLVGESGSGKSVTAMSVIGMIPAPGRVAGGTVRFQGEDITKASAKAMRRRRGKDIGLVLQDPMTALNPVQRVGPQIVEAIRAHQRMSKEKAATRAVELLRSLGIPSPEQRFQEYPHRLSGGMRQRVVLAIALANDPSLLVLDEPTTALDVTVQAQFLDLVKELRRRIGTAIVMITHDIGVVAEVCDEVVVMYGGRIMEQAPVGLLLAEPLHPYTVGLLGSVPTIGERAETLATIRGSVPSPDAMPPGCPFSNRCDHAMARCEERPPVVRHPDGRSVACWLHVEPAPARTPTTGAA
ncbi:ABC transporter ATP-binding protein [Nocardioides carbamazepini]|uniref:ABC transporter ATP-binding protein n=1 Tax=Nocardioides carbamazepini TaxID=2854259 RepID=UPI002149FB4E|nr:ABC transporter ATP-binding protein [Nocardioides carbamazepini]MCR1782373.1 ABC transporter ATP-binding protein [Nocardioides carbamazepini]